MLFRPYWASSVQCSPMITQTVHLSSLGTQVQLQTTLKTILSYIHIFYRSTWVSIEGYKYTRSDYLLIRWQADDLPCFARVEDIAVFQQKIIFLLLLCTTVGIDNHYHSYVIRKTPERTALWYEQIVDKEPHVAHVLQNGEMYVTVRSHTENTACTF